MDKLNVAQAELIIRGYRRRQQDAWARTQRIAYVVAQSNSKKRISPEKIVDLSLFDDHIFDEEIIPDEETNVAEDIRDRMAEVARNYASIIESNQS